MTLIRTKKGFVKRIRISDKKFRLIARCFIFDCTASQAGKLVSVNHNTADRYFNLLRSIIITEALTEREEEKIGNGIEIDESYFGPRRQRGKTGRGARKKIIVLGLKKKKRQSICPDNTKTPQEMKLCLSLGLQYALELIFIQIPGEVMMLLQSMATTTRR